MRFSVRWMVSLALVNIGNVEIGANLRNGRRSIRRAINVRIGRWRGCGILKNINIVLRVRGIPFPEQLFKARGNVNDLCLLRALL